MGIQDRDYYRNEGPSIFDNMMPKGLVCRWLIASLSSFSFCRSFPLTATQIHPDEPMAGPSTSGWVTDWLILDVHEVLQRPNLATRDLCVLASTDPGGFFFHIVFQHVFLWWFGSDVEQLYGSKEFLAILSVSAFLGASLLRHGD